MALARAAAAVMACLRGNVIVGAVRSGCYCLPAFLDEQSGRHCDRLVLALCEGGVVLIAGRFDCFEIFDQLDVLLGLGGAGLGIHALLDKNVVSFAEHLDLLFDVVVTRVGFGV